MRNTLGLDDDLDGVELVQNLEASFGVKFSNSEAEACRTVGDIFTLLKVRFSAESVPKQGCASAIAFYRLKRALKYKGALLLMAPTSRLDEISSLPPKVLFRGIRAHSALRLPSLKSGRLGVTGCFVMLLSVALAVVNTRNLRSALFLLGVAAIGSILMRFDRGKFPDECQTLGDLARKVAGLNFGRLVKLGAGQRDKDLWAALLEVITEHSPILKTKITPKTLLLQSQLRAA